MESSSLKTYLKRYATTEGDKETQGKKKKKNTKKGSNLRSKPASSKQAFGVVIVDDDVSWHKPLQQDTDDEEDGLEEGPQVIEDVEVKRMQKMEAVRMHRPYLSIGDDGSGWVDVISSVRSENIMIGDLSPPKNRRHDSSSPSPEPETRRDLYVEPVGDDGRFSGTRQPDEIYERSRPIGDLSPPRRKVIESTSSKFYHDGDLSPPRKRVRNEALPARRATINTDKHVKDMDLSPPRRSSNQNKKRRESSIDSSELKKSSALEVSFSVRSSIKSERSQKSPDLSPPRKRSQDKARKNCNNSERYLSGKDRSHDDICAPENARKSFPKDTIAHSTQANKHHERPQRDGKEPESATIGRHVKNLVQLGKAHAHEADEGMKGSKMTDGTSAGLRSINEMREEVEQKKEAEAKRFAEMDPLLSGKGAAIVYRNKQGKRLDNLEALQKQQKGDSNVKDEPLEWGKGLVQKREVEAWKANLEKEKQLPFARSRDDPELDNLLKEAVRWGDPMAHLVKKKVSQHSVEDLGMDDKMKESGFIIPQGIPEHSWLKRGIGPPPNRYGVKPGRHWDGVDRSTGFEKELFKQKNEKKANELEAYLWSVSEM